jgi:hypothetical protein
MQKCALCEFDYHKVGLQEGRCPQCGNIIEWPEEPEDQVANARAADSMLTEKTSEGPLSQQPTLEVPIDPSFVDSSPTAPSHLQADGSSLPTEMVQLWRDSIEGTLDVRSTLKGPVSNSNSKSSNTISDSVFAIRPREVRSPLSVTEKPVDYELLDVIGQGGVGVGAMNTKKSFWPKRF